MKKIQLIFLLLISLIIASSFSSCLHKDYYTFFNDYSIANTTNEDIQVIYTTLQRNDTVYSLIIEPSQEKNIYSSTNVTLMEPSNVIEQILFLSVSHDTIMVMDKIDDSQWLYSETTYMFEKNRRWLYTFSKTE